jgi:hypothetical protein
LADAVRPSNVTLLASSGAHRIDQEPATMAGRDFGDPLDRVEDARGGLALHRRDVADRPLLGEHAIERAGVVRLVLRRFQHRHLAAMIARHPDHALAVGAVDQDQELAVPRHERAEHRLDHEGAAALEWYGDVAAGSARQLDETCAHPRVERDEGAVARAPVAQHRALDGRRRGQRAGGQEIRLARSIGHGGRPQGRSVEDLRRPRA